MGVGGKGEGGRKKEIETEAHKKVTINHRQICDRWGKKFKQRLCKIIMMMNRVGQTNSFFCFSLKIIKTKVLKMCIFVNFFRRKYQRRMLLYGNRVRSPRTPWPSSWVKKIFFSRALFEMGRPPLILSLENACLGNRCTQKIQSRALCLFFEKLAFI